MHRILIVPLPEPGHIIPTLPLARHLIDGGCEVTYLTAPSLSRHITGVGAKITPLIPDGSSEREATGSRIWTLFLRDALPGERSRKLVELISIELQESPGSVLLLDRILASPAVLSINASTVLFGTSLPNWNEMESARNGRPTIVFCPSAFEVPKFRYTQESTHFVESSIGAIEAEGAACSFSPHTPLIIAAFGTQSVKDRRLAAKYELITQLACRHSEYQVLLATPRQDLYSSVCPEPAPSNLTIMQHIPQRHLLTKAAVFISHGGLGGIKEAIIAGVPMIVLPGSYDQPFNAMRVRFHGLGDALFEEHLDITRLEALVESALKGDFDPGLATMKQSFLAMERARISHLLFDMFLAKI
jgi:UDP:flavonoid glycosyltransferase YjiC (YdhE family)